MQITRRTPGSFFFVQVPRKNGKSRLTLVHKFKGPDGKMVYKRKAVRADFTRAQQKQIVAKLRSQEDYLEFGFELPSVKMALRDLVIEYAAQAKRLKKKAPKTIADEKRIMLLLCGKIGDYEIRNLKAADVERFVADRNYSANSARLLKAALKAAYKYAIQEKYVSQNPALAITTPRLEASAPRHVPPISIRKILDSTKGRIRVYFMILAYTGIRPKEGVALKVSDLDFPNRLITITRSKTKRFRHVPIPTALETVLMDYIAGKAPDDYLFPGKSGGHQVDMGSALARAKKRAGVDKLGRYSFRHTFGALGYNGSKDLRAMQLMMGHSKSTMTEVYTHSLPDSIHKAANSIIYPEDSPQG